MKLMLFSRDGKDLIQGIVTEKRPGTGSAEGKVVNIKLKGKVYNAMTKSEEEKEIDVAFWNKDYMKLADSANERIQVGEYVSILAVQNAKGNYSALLFKKAGLWTFKPVEDDPVTGQKGSKETNILIGTIANGRLSDDEKCFRSSMPVSSYDKETGENNTNWVSITFWNSEKYPTLGTNANKCLKPSESDGKKICKRAAVICGPKSTYMTSDMQEHDSFAAYRFERTDI